MDWKILKNRKEEKGKEEKIRKGREGKRRMEKRRGENMEVKRWKERENRDGSKAIDTSKIITITNS